MTEPRLPLRAASGQRTPTLQNIFLVHGESGPAQALTERLQDLRAPIHYPERGTRIEL
jgi:hypothetical protein